MITTGFQWVFYVTVFIGNYFPISSYFTTDWNEWNNPSRPNPGRREKSNWNFLFSHFFVVLQKVLWRPLRPLIFILIWFLKWIGRDGIIAQHEKLWKHLPILHEGIGDNYFIVKCSSKSNVTKIFLFTDCIGLLYS